MVKNYRNNCEKLESIAAIWLFLNEGYQKRKKLSENSFKTIF
jgi:hypothetical protein